MSKNKKMANLGLIIALVGGLMVPIGVYMFNKYSGKSRVESHSEVIKKQEEVGNKVDNSKKEIIEQLTKEKQTDKTNPGEKETITDKKQEMSNSKSDAKNQIINNAPNQGVQINENHGTVIVPKPLARSFSISDAKKILKDYPSDFPIEIWLKGTNTESKNLFNQVVDAVKSLGYNNVSTTTIGIYGTTESIEKDFQYGVENGKLVFSIYLLQ